MKCLGNHQYCHNEGAARAASPYFPPTLSGAIGDMATHVDKALSLGIDSKASVALLDVLEQINELPVQNDFTLMCQEVVKLGLSIHDYSLQHDDQSFIQEECRIGDDL